MATMMMITAVITMQQQQGGRLQDEDESDMSGFACLLLVVGLSWAQVDKLKLSFAQSGRQICLKWFEENLMVATSCNEH